MRRELQALSHRPGAGDARPASRTRCGAPPTAWRRARSWPTTRGSSGTICGSIWLRFCSGAACRSTASTCARGGGPGQQRERSWFPQGYRVLQGRACSPERRARGRALALLSLSALAWRRGADLQSAARNGARIRCRAVRLHGWRGEHATAACSNSARAWCWSEAALPRAALVHAAAARGARIPLAGHAPGPRRASARLRLRSAPGGIHATCRIRRRRAGGARRHLRPFRPDRPPRAHSCRLVGLVPLAALRNARRRAGTGTSW